MGGYSKYSLNYAYNFKCIQTQSNVTVHCHIVLNHNHYVRGYCSQNLENGSRVKKVTGRHNNFVPFAAASNPWKANRMRRISRPCVDRGDKTILSRQKHVAASFGSYMQRLTASSSSLLSVVWFWMIWRSSIVLRFCGTQVFLKSVSSA